MIEIRDAAGVAKSAKAIEVRDGSGTAVPAKIVQIRDENGTAKTVWAAMTAAAAPDPVNGYSASPSAIDITTAQATATPTGGVAPYSYAWARTDAGSETWNIIAASSASTAFRCLAVPSGDVIGAAFECLVTDANGVTATTPDITAYVTNLDTWNY